LAHGTAKYRLSDCKPLLSPLPAGCNLAVIERTPHNDQHLPYQQIVGSLLYIALATHPDILFPVIYLTCFLCVFDHMHFAAAHQVLM
jgi:hypothetical protein